MFRNPTIGTEKLKAFIFGLSLLSNISGFESNMPSSRPANLSDDDSDSKKPASLPSSSSRRSQDASNHGDNIDSMSNPNSSYASGVAFGGRSNSQDESAFGSDELFSATTSVPVAAAAPAAAAPQQHRNSNNLDVIPTQEDILMGRGVPFQKHNGNMKLQALVEKNRERYRNMSRSCKSGVVKELLRQLKRSGSRFLVRREGCDSKDLDDTDGWVLASRADAYDKVCHALRGKSSIYRQQQSEKNKSNSKQSRVDSSSSKSTMHADAVQGPPLISSSPATTNESTSIISQSGMISDQSLSGTNHNVLNDLLSAGNHAQNPHHQPLGIQSAGQCLQALNATGLQNLRNNMVLNDNPFWGAGSVGDIAAAIAAAQQYATSIDNTSALLSNLLNLRAAGIIVPSNNNVQLPNLLRQLQQTQFGMTPTLINHQPYPNTPFSMTPTLNDAHHQQPIPLIPTSAAAIPDNNLSLSPSQLQGLLVPLTDAGNIIPTMHQTQEESTNTVKIEDDSADASFIDDISPDIAARLPSDTDPAILLALSKYLKQKKKNKK